MPQFAVVRVVLQRVSQASVTVERIVVGAIGCGLLALVGIEPGDGPADAERLAGRTARARVFASEVRDFDRSVREVGGAVLCVSQFTLFADLRRGSRPSWSGAAPPSIAEQLVATFAQAVATEGVDVSHGVFGAHMEISLVCDGPVTLVLDSTPPAKV